MRSRTISLSLRWLLCLLPLLWARGSAAATRTVYDQEVEALQARLLAAIQARSPAAVVPVLELPGYYDLVSDRGALAGGLQKAEAAAWASQPLVAAQALWQRAQIARHQGLEIKRVQEELGLCTRFSVVGPFDNEGQRGHSTAFPPELEEAPDGDATYEGKVRGQKLRWWVRPPLSRDGSLPLSALSRPEDWITHYAAVYLYSPRPQRVALRLTAGGAVKLWVNRGDPVLVRDRYEPLRTGVIDQEVAAARLLAGWNRVLVKVSGNEEPSGLLLRVTTPEGKPLTDLTGLRQEPAPPEKGWRVPRAVPDAGPAPSALAAALRAAVKAARGPGRAEALSQLGLYLHYVSPGDPADREEETLLEEAARIRGAARDFRLWAQGTTDQNRRRRIIEEGLQKIGAAGPAAPERGRMLLELGRIYEEGRRERLAEQAYREALPGGPALYTAVLHLSQLQTSRGLPAEGERVLKEGLPAELLAGPAAPIRVLRARATLAAQLGQVTEAESLQEAVLAARADDLEALRQRMERQRGRGQLTEALATLGRMRAARPDMAWLIREQVEVLEGAARYEEALQVLAEAGGRVERDAELLALRGRLLERVQKRPAALAAYRRSLELKPQNPELRSYLQRLDPSGQSGDDLVRRFHVALKDLARPPAERKERDPARVLLDQQVTRVHQNGLSEVYSQRVLEVLDERGAREYNDAEIRYTPDTQSVQVKAAKVYKRSGEVREGASQGERDASEPWYGLYYDVRALSLRFEALEPGDVIEVEYVVADVGRRNLLADYFGDMHYFQEDIPRLDSRYLLLLPEPEGRRHPLYLNVVDQKDVPKVTREERVVGSGEAAQRLYGFRLVGAPKLVAEAGMPGYSEIATFLHVSTFRSWEDVATFYQGLVKEQLQTSPEIRQAAQKAVAGLKDERQKVRALYDLVVQRTRYVGLEFGIHGYKPYKVSQVFARKFGDCKDKAALLHVMLHEVGIESSMVLARTRRNGDLPKEPASLSAFDHAIVYVPRFDLYLDGTAEFSGSDELPEQDQDIAVLVVSDPRPPFLGKGHLARTPVLAGAQNTVSRTLQVALRSDGGAHVRDEMRVAGQVAQKWREHYQAKDTRAERYEKTWTEVAPGTRVKEVSMPGLLDLEKPVALTGEVDAPAGTWGRRSGAGKELLVHPLGREPDLLRSFARLSQRRYDLILGFPWRNQEQVTLRLAPGQRLARLPEPREVTSPFGRFRLTVDAGDKEVTFKADLQVDRHRVSSQEYPEFRRFCAQVDAVVGQDVVVGHE